MGRNMEEWRGWRENRKEIIGVNTRAISRRQNELIRNFKMAAGDVISIEEVGCKYRYIQGGIKRGWCGLKS